MSSPPASLLFRKAMWSLTRHQKCEWAQRIPVFFCHFYKTSGHCSENKTTFACANLPRMWALFHLVSPNNPSEKVKVTPWFRLLKFLPTLRIWGIKWGKGRKDLVCIFYLFNLPNFTFQFSTFSNFQFYIELVVEDRTLYFVWSPRVICYTMTFINLMKIWEHLFHYKSCLSYPFWIIKESDKSIVRTTHEKITFCYRPGLEQQQRIKTRPILLMLLCV